MKGRDRVMARSVFEGRLDAMRKEVEKESERILYGPTAPSRRAYLSSYGCTKPTTDAVSAIAALGQPIVEMGAGVGHWEKALRTAGVDVVAYDDWSAVPGADDEPVAKGRATEHSPGPCENESAALVGKVLHGTPDVTLPHNPGRALLLVYPGPDAMAEDSLTHYSGSTLVYVGENAGGANATPRFFQELQRAWKVVKVMEVEPFSGGCERMWILKRT
ncbi:hypothetical protein M427DRAFT_50507 [Gonapodya prolifera JEL478]|uniref:Class I SAM-dependent methyltransferase n=1 Tax=Gonapodya prolifera (strain JEL478) TaxID=1344416 RepID=A0A139AZJ9_GONPJ|nr:hypothetical protein M427DRAFT_50507 [Gonapodya prolifera JEL478]|eukprot:KXS22149.1 hypothetical protein M427DRAFT_50507 [Gonapodya prolifera JEL478]